MPAFFTTGMEQKRNSDSPDSDYIMENPKWEFSLQLHKYIQMP